MILDQVEEVEAHNVTDDEYHEEELLNLDLKRIKKLSNVKRVVCFNSKGKF